MRGEPGAFIGCWSEIFNRPSLQVRDHPTLHCPIQYDGAVKVGKVNVDENPEAAGTYRILSIPTVLLFKDGQVVDRIIGAHPLQRYEQALAKVKE